MAFYPIYTLKVVSVWKDDKGVLGKRNRDNRLVALVYFELISVWGCVDLVGAEK
jgi:hypothetical protein